MAVKQLILFFPQGYLFPALGWKVPYFPLPPFSVQWSWMISVHLDADRRSSRRAQSVAECKANFFIIFFFFTGHPSLRMLSLYLSVPPTIPDSLVSVRARPPKVPGHLRSACPFDSSEHRSGCHFLSRVSLIFIFDMWQNLYS